MRLTGFGVGNINLSTDGSPVGRYAVQSLQLSYGGTASNTFWAGGTHCHSWYMNIDIYRVHSIAQINATRRHAQDLIDIAKNILTYFQFWLLRDFSSVAFADWAAGTAYIAGQYINRSGTSYYAKRNSTGKDPALWAYYWEESITPWMIEATEFISQSTPTLVSVNDRNEWHLRQQYLIKGKDSFITDFEL
jgi:hypothetical protein